LAGCSVSAENQGKRDVMAESVEIRVTSGASQKVDRHPLKKFIDTPQKVHRFPSETHPLLSILMSCILNSWPFPSNVKIPQPTFERELTIHHKPYKSVNKPFNYQASQNLDLVYFISQDWPNRFRFKSSD
jgi:hypothetical protein